jgi:hypothetical protein
MSNTKPFVALACVCEKALQDADGVMSLIRVIDTFFTGLQPGAPAGAFPVINFVIVVSLKSGDLKGSFDKLEIVMENPTKERKKMSDKPVRTDFTGGANGINVQINSTVEVRTFGLYWFDVLWGGDVLTRIPVEIKRLAEHSKQMH